MTCGAYVPLGIPKYVWIDADNQSKISVHILNIGSDGNLLSEEDIEATYLDNEIWRVTIPPLNIDGYVLGIVKIDEIKDSFVLRYGNPEDRFFYRAPNFKTEESYEFLQLDENANVIDYGLLNEIGYGFYQRKILKKQISLICVDDICAVYKYPIDFDCSNVTNEEELQECLKAKEEYYEKLVLLEKKLNDCLSSNKNISVGTVNVITSGEASPITTTTNIIKTESSKPLTTSDRAKMDTSENVKINNSLTSNINTRLK